MDEGMWEKGLVCRKLYLDSTPPPLSSRPLIRIRTMEEYSLTNVKYEKTVTG